MAGGSRAAPAERAAVEQTFSALAGEAEEEDPIVSEELVLLDFPEFSFAPSLRKRKYASPPAPAGAAGAAAELAAEVRETEAPPSTAVNVEPIVSNEDNPIAGEATSNSGDEASSITAAHAAFLRRADLKVHARNLGTSTPSLLLGDFSFKGERQSQRMYSTALFRVDRQQNGQQDKASVSADGAQRVHLQGIARQVMSFAVDTTAAASKAASADAAVPNQA
ncbi:hypothetical protein Emed_003161 [Eimeria media]